jgi:Ca-activated chloride channel family protein
LRFCLENLTAKDRFALINFSTGVNLYKDGLLEASSEQIKQANKWVDELDATGGTAINDALATALGLRSKDEGRGFTIVFFTDGEPTIGETNPEKILKNVAAKNTATTRIFTFGVGDDVNATFLDQLADQTRAVSTYVRPAEDISVKVAGLYAKISHPVLASLKLSVTNDVTITDVYPPQLPDLFHGQQLIVLGRFSGKGASAVRLTGSVGMESKEFAYDLTFPDKTNDDRSFVEPIWARRKVGYLLDQIRANGEKKELVDEAVHELADCAGRPAAGGADASSSGWSAGAPAHAGVPGRRLRRLRRDTGSPGAGDPGRPHGECARLRQTRAGEARRRGPEPRQAGR